MPSITIQIPSRDDDVFGEVPLAPSGLTGVSESQLARAMAGRMPVAAGGHVSGTPTIVGAPETAAGAG